MINKKLSIFLSLMLSLTVIFPTSHSTAKASTVTESESVGTVLEEEQGSTPTAQPTISEALDTSNNTTQQPTLGVEPTLSATPINPTLSPVTPTPSGIPTVPTPTVTPITPAPTGIPITPTITAPTPTTTPMPTRIPFRSKTLERMYTYDYVKNSVTGISQKKVAVRTLQSYIKPYGTLYGIGMPFEEYKAAMSNQWDDVTEYDKKPLPITVDISKTMNYSTYVSILKKLSRYEGVYVYRIGTSTEGRAIYAIEIDMTSNYKKNVVMMTGQIHAREFAGGTFIVKELVDLVQKAQKDKKTMDLLKRNKYVAVPIINVDGREALINSPTKWTYKGGELLKAYTNGIDGGRNFPGLQWGQVAKGSTFKSLIATRPTYANYPGSYAGSNKETKAMMKWLYHYTVVEKASLYLDMHQQGSIIYAGKTWQTKTQERKSHDLRTNVMNVLNKGITARKYSRVYESGLYGMRGEGSSLTDYAITLAVGAKFSPAYGFSAFTDGKKEYILLQIKDLDLSKIKFKEANSNFAAITMEIGYGRKYLGNSTETRRLLANEYNYYNYGKLLEALPQMIK